MNDKRALVQALLSWIIGMGSINTQADIRFIAHKHNTRLFLFRNSRQRTRVISSPSALFYFFWLFSLIPSVHNISFTHIFICLTMSSCNPFKIENSFASNPHLYLSFISLQIVPITCLTKCPSEVARVSDQYFFR